MRNLVKEIQDELLTAGITAPVGEIEPIVKKLTDYNVIEDEIVRTTFNQLVNKYKPGEKIKHGSAPVLKLKEITKNKQSATVRVKFLEEFDNSVENIAQVGVVGDESGTMKLTVWKDCKTNVRLVIGKCYEIKSAYSNEYKGNISIQAGKFAGITEITDDIAAMSTEPEITGTIVAIQEGSGLVNRCTFEIDRNGKKVPCNKVLDKNVCKDHGKQTKYSLDLRVKAVIDNGTTAITTVINAKTIEQVTGLSLNKASEMASEAADRAVVEEELKTMLLGKYFRVKGRVSNDFLFVSEMSAVEKLDVDYNALMRRAMAL